MKWIQALLWEMMKTIFSLSLALLTFLLFSEEITKRFEVKNYGQGAGFAELEATNIANKMIVNYSYLLFLNKKMDSKILTSCWKEYLVNKKIKIDITDSSYQLLFETNDSFVYEVKLDPTKIKIFGATRDSFLNFCKTNNSK